eukprot:TRINITY_DN13635_c0_g1_i1.p2 TRINITY_DN13635_c0_g1~~TRINITY_DN13635_c0_g1_i1.p2  ORF type:complete len:227 (+),score=137.47 TRINITY_DN13635_c0_g1_i1:181-861(+)
MAFFSRLLGGGGSTTAPKPRAAPAPTTSAAESISNTTETLDKRIKVLDKQIEQQENMAKEHLKKKAQKQAMSCLKKKKMYEEQRTKLEAQRMNMEQLLMTTQEAEQLRDVVRAQQHAQTELKHSMPSLEEVENTQEALQEQLDNQRDISDMLAQPLAGNELDEDDLLAELDGLQDEVDEEYEASLIPDMPSTAALPDPNKDKAVKAKAEEDEDEDLLAGLAAEMGA